MADPRKTIRHDNIKVTEVAYKNDSSIVFDDTKQGGSASVGLAVTLSADKTVGLAGDGEAVLVVQGCMTDANRDVAVHQLGGRQLGPGDGLRAATFGPRDEQSLETGDGIGHRAPPELLSPTSR